jgi:hypothetical protein
MQLTSVHDQAFLERVRAVIELHGEALILFRYWARAGAKDFMFFNDYDSFCGKLVTMPANTSVIVFGDPQLSLRGYVDEVFVERALEAIPEGTEFLILCMEKTAHDFHPHHYSETFDDSAGETHAELIEELKEFNGRRVALGTWPPWPEDSSGSFGAYVPGDDGVIRPGPY